MAAAAGGARRPAAAAVTAREEFLRALPSGSATAALAVSNCERRARDVSIAGTGRRVVVQGLWFKV